MSCANTKKLCNKLIISDAVTFADGTLTIDIPEGSYQNGEKYCIVVAQSIPETTTIVAPVAITIGGDTTTTYPLLNCDCTTVYACSINTRTRYSIKVQTDIASGIFRLLGKMPCSRCTSNLASLPAPAETGIAG
jgi:hypothetical protein